MEMISDEIPHGKVIKSLMKEAKQATSSKMKDLCYYYTIIFIQNALKEHNIKDELYATLLDLFESNCVKEINVLYNTCKDSGLNTDLLNQWQKIVEEKGKEKIEHILNQEKTAIVDTLMSFKRDTDKIIQFSFNNNSEFRMGQK